MRKLLFVLALGLLLGGRAHATSTSLGAQAAQHRRDQSDALAIEGRVVSASHGKLVVKTVEGPERAVRVNGFLTRVMLEGHRVRLRDLKPGQWVRASVPSRAEAPLAMHVDVWPVTRAVE